MDPFEQIEWDFRGFHSGRLLEPGLNDGVDGGKPAQMRFPPSNPTSDRC